MLSIDPSVSILTKIQTLGASAVVGGALGGRSWWVAKKKLEIVNAELESRNITLYDTKKRDVIIPVTVGALKVAITCGLGKAHPVVTVGDCIVKVGKMGAKNAVGSLAYRYSSSETEEYSQVCTLDAPVNCYHYSDPVCLHCSRNLHREEYYHCCLCEDSGYQFNACETCMTTLGVGCRDRKAHQLHRVAFTLDGKVTASGQKGTIMASTTEIKV